MITPEMIADGLDSGTVSITDSPHGDGPICQIGDYWFWFAGSEAEQTTAAEYTANVPKEDIVREIMDVLDDFRTLPENQDEYAYYEAFLREKADVRENQTAITPCNMEGRKRQSNPRRKPKPPSR